MRATASAPRPDFRVVFMFLTLGVLVGRWTSQPVVANDGCVGEDDVFGKFGDVSVYDFPEVTPAPPSPSPKGSFSFSDERGTYERREFRGTDYGDPPYVNVMRTFAGNFRSGDVHKCHQINVLAYGEAMVTTMEMNNDRKLVPHTRKVTGGDRVVIPAHTPHLYEFTEDTLMTESWVNASDRTRCAFSAWFYKPLRDKVGDPTKTFTQTS